MTSKEEIEELKYQNNLKDIEIYKLNTELKELRELEKEHQKLNGEMQKKLTYYEEVLEGKAIQEMGVSDLYGVDEQKK